MKDFFQSLMSAAGQRVRSPFLGVFAIAWAFINWRFLLVIFSGETVERKFSIIDQFVYVGEFEKILHFFVLPSLVGLCYVLIYPAFDILFCAIQEWFDNLKARLVLFIHRKRPFDEERTLEYFRNFDEELLREKEKFQKIIEREAIDRRKLEAAIERASNNAKRLARRVFLGASSVRLVDFDLAVKSRASDFSEEQNAQEISLALKRSPFMGKFRNLFELCESIPQNSFGRKIASFGEVSDALFEEGESVGGFTPSEFVELTLLLDLASLVSEGENHLAFNVEALRRLVSFDMEVND